MTGPSEQNESTHAMASVFVTALLAAGEDVRREVLARMLNDEDLRDDVEAALLWEERKGEDSRSLRDVLSSFGDNSVE
ncbi:MAG: hypothetical protein IT350_09030 [Deltaproteobacteria bacterium]|nr:hypothetical protein [Deltaproteobacteria bacterium]